MQRSFNPRPASSARRTPLTAEAEHRTPEFQSTPRFISEANSSADALKQHLERVSVLGGQKIEGIVAKNYHRFGVDKKILIGKYVSEAFKEIHHGDWKDRQPRRQDDVMTELVNMLRSPARWEKAVQHLRDGGRLIGSPVDIGPLIKETQEDTLKECRELITEMLLNWCWPQIKGRLIQGMPEWYKEKSLSKQFEKGEQ